MFFLISKLAWMALAPVTVMLEALGLGIVLIWARRARAGLWIVTVAGGTMAVTGVVPLGALVLHPLENRFAPLSSDAPAPTGIVVLGGSTDQELTLARGRVTIADAGERLTEAVVLARRYPAARLVFTGGSAAIEGSDDSEAADARRLWIAMGIPEARIVTENRSRNTDENVRFTKPLVDPKPGESWILVTSAFHMPRAVALFRSYGWPVVPDPVDYRTRGTWRDLRPHARLTANWALLELSLHEWTGLLAYRLTGRTATLLPAP